MPSTDKPDVLVDVCNSSIPKLRQGHHTFQPSLGYKLTWRWKEDDQKFKVIWPPETVIHIYIHTHTHTYIYILYNKITVVKSNKNDCMVVDHHNKRNCILY